MAELAFHGVDVGLFEGGEDLVGRVIESVDEAPEIRDGDVVVIASKVVSLAEDRLVALDEVAVSPRAERIADVTGIDEREVALILRESRVLGAIPIAKLAAERLAEQAADPEGARQALEELPSLLLTVRNGRLCTNAGIDLSNSPEGMATLLPGDPDASARRIREEFAERAGVDVAVVVTDSEVNQRGGSVDVAIGCSGIEPVDSSFGATDLFGTPKLGGVDLVADELAAGTALLMGQTAERIPVVIVRGLDSEEGEGVESDAELIRSGLVPTLVQSVRVKLAERLPIY